MSMSSLPFLLLVFVGPSLEYLGVRVHTVAHPRRDHRSMTMLLHHLHVHTTVSGHSKCLGMAL